MYPLRLVTEIDSSCFCVHTVNYRKGFKVIAKVSYGMSAHLEALFDDDSYSFNSSPRSVYDRDKSLEGAAVCEEIVNDENFILGGKIFL